MKKVFKYTLLEVPQQAIVMPSGAVLLSVHMQKGEACLWALVDTDNPPAARHVGIYGTGMPVPDSPGAFVGTELTDGGHFVFHVFDEGEKG
jgi:hypothetical protein